MIRSVSEQKSATLKNGKLENMLQKMEKQEDVTIKNSNDKFVSGPSDASCKSLLKQLNGDLPETPNDQHQKPEQEAEKPS